jgi:LPXTG-motif cell wall-anchored protein
MKNILHADSRSIKRSKRSGIGSLLVVLGAVALTTSHVRADTNEAPISSPNSGVFSALSLGSYFTCIVTDSGGAKCWGYNDFGTLGDGTTTDRNVPVDVSGLTSGVQSISAGTSHACAVTTAGGAKCWGYNGSGTLGDGTTTDSNIPVDVSGLTSGVQSISTPTGLNGDHTCAVTTAGGAKCWGLNSKGQLGDGTEITRNTPVDVSGLTSGVQSISAGESHSCALTTNGGVKCWGNNASGQLGDGTADGTQKISTTPVDVTGLISGATAITVGKDWACALTTSGAVKCWGDNEYGLGALDGNNSAITNSNVPVQVEGLTSGVLAISIDFKHACALLSTGSVKCWGFNLKGQLGDGTTTDSNTPVDVAGLPDKAVAVSVGYRHSCAILESGSLYCWGSNGVGQLGDGTTTDQLQPINVSALGTAVGPGVTTTTTVVTTTTVAAGDSTATTTAANKSKVQKADRLPETGADTSVLVLLGSMSIIAGAIIVLRRRLLH